MVPALALVNVEEDVDAAILLDAALEHAGRAALDELVVDDVVWKAKAEDNLFEKLNRRSRITLADRLRFNLLGELVNHHQQVRHTAPGHLEGSDHVESPDREGPGDGDGL